MNRDRWWKWQHRFAPYFFVAPFVLLFSIFTLYPMYRSLLLSFYKTAGPRHQVFVGLDNYRYLLGHDLAFLLAVVNSAGFTIAFLVLQIPMSLGLALLLTSRHVRFRNLFRFSFFSSYLVGQVFAGVIFFQIFGARGLLNRILGAVAGHTILIPWLTSPHMVMPSLLIASLWLATGYGMVYFLAALQAVDRELYDAAQVDGAGRWQSFLHITLPGIRPVLIYVTLVGTIYGFQLFELPYVLLQGSGPNGRGLTIVMYLFSMGFNSGDLGYASAIGWTLMLILLLVSLAQVKFTGAAKVEA
ncbi:MAG: sugar ABC transporter permease [Planctomycetota bacterium]|nr:sugar ABC transporter permease [Planctomycetota bacterium]